MNFEQLYFKNNEVQTEAKYNNYKMETESEINLKPNSILTKS